MLDCQKNSLKYSVAGALPLPSLISENTSTYLVGDGPPIGLFEDALFSEYELDLPKISFINAIRWNFRSFK